jgi:hypothetical protein
MCERIASDRHADRKDTVSLTDFQRELCETSPFDFTDLRALYVNCTLKRRPSSRTPKG